jgi:hypothetical protein
MKVSFGLSWPNLSVMIGMLQASELDHVFGGPIVRCLLGGQLIQAVAPRNPAFHTRLMMQWPKTLGFVEGAHRDLDIRFSVLKHVHWSSAVLAKAARDNHRRPELRRNASGPPEVLDGDWNQRSGKTAKSLLTHATMADACCSQFSGHFVPERPALATALILFQHDDPAS